MSSVHLFLWILSYLLIYILPSFTYLQCQSSSWDGPRQRRIPCFFVYLDGWQNSAGWEMNWSNSFKTRSELPLHLGITPHHALGAINTLKWCNAHYTVEHVPWSTNRALCLSHTQQTELNRVFRDIDQEEKIVEESRKALLACKAKNLKLQKQVIVKSSWDQHAPHSITIAVHAILLHPIVSHVTVRAFSEKEWHSQNPELGDWAHNCKPDLNFARNSHITLNCTLYSKGAFVIILLSLWKHRPRSWSCTR